MQIERRFPKAYKYVAPAVVLSSAWLASCTSQENSPRPGITPAPTNSGEVLPANITPSFSPTPTEGSAQEGGQQNTVLVTSGANKYELPRGVKLEEMLGAADSLPQTIAKESIINNLRGVQTALNINPQDQTVVLTLNRVINMIDANCVGDEYKDLTKQIAGYVFENYQDQYEGTKKLAEQGPCSVLEEETLPETSVDQANNELIKSLEPTKFNVDIYTAFRGDYAYTYTLHPHYDLETGLQGAIDLLSSNPRLTATINQDVLAKVIADIGQVLDIAKSDINNPRINEMMLNTGLEFSKECTDTNLPGSLMIAFASAINERDPDYWKENQFKYIDTNCYTTLKQTYSPQFKAEALPDGNFVYKGVSYDDVINYARQLEPMLHPNQFTKMITNFENAKNNTDNADVELTSWYDATNVIRPLCSSSDKVLNTIRLAVSIVNEKRPDTPYQTNTINSFKNCNAVHFNNPYYFEP